MIWIPFWLPSFVAGFLLAVFLLVLVAWVSKPKKRRAPPERPSEDVIARCDVAQRIRRPSGYHN